MELPEKCACSGGNLDRFLQPIILAILKEEPMTGYMIVKKIAGYSTFRENGPDPTGVYRYLKIMWGKGMLDKAVHPNDDKGDAVPYCITPLGEKCLGQWRQTLQDYGAQIHSLIEELDVS